MIKTKNKQSVYKRKPSVKKNFIYNALYQVFTMLVPLITTPYISKVLLPEGVGKYSYTYSIVNYFVLFAQLGFGYYAQREVSKYQGNKQQQSIIFAEIMLVRICTVWISVTVYIILCLCNVFGEYTTLMWWWLILIISQGFDIAFLFQGNEEFAKVVVRNLIIKILGIILIFTMVNSKEDIWIYILCIAGSNFLGILSTWIYLPQFVCKVDRHLLHPVRHVLPAIRLFIPTIAAVIYTTVDVTLIGILIKDTYTTIKTMHVHGLTKVVEITTKFSDVENGFYAQSEKIVNVGMSIITALGAVMLPRNAKLSSSGDADGLKKNIYISSRFVWILGLPIMFGLIAIAPNLIPWFLGKGYEKCIIYLQLFCPLVILIGFDSVFGLQYLLATGRDAKYTLAIIAGTAINIILNAILIPKFWGYGAILASIIAELMIVAIMYLSIRNEISLAKILSISRKYLIASGTMFIALFFIQKFVKPSIINTILLIALGGTIYFTMLIGFREQFVIGYIKLIKNKVLKKEY